MEWLEVEGKTAEAKEEVEKAEKRRNRFEADVLLTGLREWDRRLKAPENYLEGLSEAWEPVDSPS